jgi:hypothetical protein
MKGRKHDQKPYLVSVLGETRNGYSNVVSMTESEAIRVMDTLGVMYENGDLAWYAVEQVSRPISFRDLSRALFVHGVKTDL